MYKFAAVRYDIVQLQRQRKPAHNKWSPLEEVFMCGDLVKNTNNSGKLGASYLVDISYCIFFKHLDNYVYIYMYIYIWIIYYIIVVIVYIPTMSFLMANWAFLMVKVPMPLNHYHTWRILNLLPSGKHTWLLNIAIYSWFTFWKWWFP